MRLFKKKALPPIPYDSAAREPVVRQSICTGEMTLGFRDRETGRFHEYALARSREEVETFCRRVGVEPKDIPTIY